MVAQAEKVGEVATNLSRAAQEQMDQSAQGLSKVSGLEEKKDQEDFPKNNCLNQISNPNLKIGKKNMF